MTSLRLPSCHLRRQLSFSCAVMAARSARHSHHSDRGKEKAAGFPPHFESKIRGWVRLVEHELKARANLVNQNQAYALSDLKLVSVKRSVLGDVAYLRIAKLLTDNEKDQVSRLVCSLNKGTPVSIVRDGASAVGASGVFLGFNDCDSETGADETIMIKMIGDSRLNRDDDASYRLVQEEENGFFRRLQKMFEQRKEWPKYPGYKLLLYTYRARQLSAAYADRPLTLPRVGISDTGDQGRRQKDLNKDQCEAIAAVLNTNRPITAILGPPGTGKTKVIGQIIAECVRARKKVLVCAPSHKALENIMAVCRRRGLDKHCKLHGEERHGRYLQTLVRDHSYFPILDGCYRELNTVVDSGALDDHADGEALLRKMRGRISSLERQIRIDIAARTEIFMCTLSTAGILPLIDMGFTPDLTIIDEAGQAMEVETWPMLFQAPRAVVVGDHKQLSPMLMSERARADGLNVSLIETLAHEHGRTLLFKLREQYRSNYLIQEWPSREFYNGELKAHPTCANIHLRDIIKAVHPNLSSDDPSSTSPPLIDDPLVLVDTDLLPAGDDAAPRSFAERFFNHSFYNVGEATLCAVHLRRLVDEAGVEPQLIGCIAPYTQQVREIKHRLPKELQERLDVSSVDAFQGQEREVIVMSFVRNNANNVIGFLDDTRRMNVALTRAKRQFLLVASGRMMQTNEAIGRLYETIRDRGRVVTPADLIPAIRLSKGPLEKPVETMFKKQFRKDRIK